ncbi:expressed unknown protein [Seminavis robusta]|uniref:Uncharacterized protein n=1 Tax=Seminavis robusta TaxID=568900 RepID=A0A9N8HY92_9STRA|nr:expressed unknown protein [Seminavis robusta]|eukprot:Sro2756_g336310.1 n/a (275) ;mRNA; f:4712-5536
MPFPVTTQSKNTNKDVRVKRSDRILRKSKSNVDVASAPLWSSNGAACQTMDDAGIAGVNSSWQNRKDTMLKRCKTYPVPKTCDEVGAAYHMPCGNHWDQRKSALIRSKSLNSGESKKAKRRVRRIPRARRQKESPPVPKATPDPEQTPAPRPSFCRWQSEPQLLVELEEEIQVQQGSDQKMTRWDTGTGSNGSPRRCTSCPPVPRRPSSPSKEDADSATKTYSPRKPQRRASVTKEDDLFPIGKPTMAFVGEMTDYEKDLIVEDQKVNVISFAA